MTSINADTLLRDGIESVPTETVTVLRDVLSGAVSDVFLVFGFSAALLCLALRHPAARKAPARFGEHVSTP